MRNYVTDTIALRKLMIERGFDTTISLATASGIDRNTVGKIVSGKVQPSAEAMDKLATTLKMEPAIAGAIFFASNLRNT